MTENCKKDLPWLEPLPLNNKTLIIVGGAPSLKKTIGDLKQRIKLTKCHVMTTNGTLKYLKSKNIIPKYHAQFDARPENVSFVENASQNTEYLIGSMSDPGVLKALEGHKVTLWHGGFDLNEQLKILNQYQYKPIVVIGGGYTIGLRALTIGYHLGYRKFVMYGIDSSFSGDEHHAYEQKLNNGDKPVPAAYQGKEYMVAPWMYRQAMNFEQNHKELTRLGCSIKVMGEGLIPDMCKHLNQQNNVL
jgi:hypothetical protein